MSHSLVDIVNSGYECMAPPGKNKNAVNLHLLGRIKLMREYRAVKKGEKERFYADVANRYFEVTGTKVASTVIQHHILKMNKTA